MKHRVKEGADSRQRIVVAATEVFAQKGKHGATMEEISAKAEVNKAMVYYYYSTKDSLFRAILVTILRRVYDHVFDILGSEGSSDASPAEKVTRLVNAHFIAFSEDVRFAKILLNALANEPGDLKAALRVIRDQDGHPKLDCPKPFLLRSRRGFPKGISGTRRRPGPHQHHRNELDLFHRQADCRDTPQPESRGR